ncbi:MAG: choice-of-anchor D domain-containing protein [Deltaproteobacteria bacterium]|nr:choice-of-anchor D domain-containing protein [Deltaproteobacteria bacterium]
MNRKWIMTLMAVCWMALLATTACECEDSRVIASLAELSAEPDPVDFGDVPVSTVREMDVNLVNRGTATVHLHGLELTLNPEDFSMVLPEGLEFPHAIPPGNQVVFTVRYHPQAYPEIDEGVVLITSTDKDAPEYELLMGGNALEPVLLIRPVPAQFDHTRVLSTDPLTMSIEHTGSQAESVTISSIAMTDDADGDFSVEEGPTDAVVLAAGESISVRLAYTPGAIDDTDEGVLTISSNAESQEVVDIPLLGSSYAPHVEVDTTALNFGTVSENSDPTLSFILSNTGNEELNIRELGLSTTGSQKFTINPESIDEPIQPGANVEIFVTYIADDQGDDTGTLRIEHDDPLEHPVFVQLHGRTPTPEVDVDPNFISIQIAGSSHTQAVTIHIYNKGDADLRILGMAFDNPDGSFSIENGPVAYPVIIPFGSDPDWPEETLQVRFTKNTTTVDDECTLTFTTNDPDEETVVVTVMGTYSP